MTSWDVTNAKAQLRLTAIRLGQLQERKDSQGQITRRDIATLLQQNNVVLARAKAQNLIQDEVVGDLMEVLEMHVGIVLEHFNELEQRVAPSPTLAEATASIIYAAPHTESKDLNIVRDFLVQYLGPDFARSAIANRDNYVSSRVLGALSAPPISAAKLNDYLSDIAVAYGAKWIPEFQPRDVLNALSEILDPTSSPVVDLPRLRRLCSHGIPEDPPWLRPRIWKILLGIMPSIKSSWDKEITKHRDNYYDLVRRLLGPFSSFPPPEHTLASSDALLMDVSIQLTRIPHSLFGLLEEEPEQNDLCPLDGAASDDVKIQCATNLDTRLQAIQDRDLKGKDLASAVTPEIRLEAEPTELPGISLSQPDALTSDTSGAQTTLLASRPLNATGAHPKNHSALIRLLYIHSSLNPANHSPHVPSLLVTLYSVLMQEIESKDQAHAEADTFWLFEAMVAEFAELEEEEGGNLWMQKFSERLVWADPDLSSNLHAKGLDPALPHYSYRWLAPLLTQTLPLSSVFMVWDALFACPARERGSNPKLDYLLDICTSLLIRARAPLFRLGKPGSRSPGLWVEENATLPPPSPLRPWELGDAFLEGMSLLQLYPVEAAGGIDRILQTASDLAHRREEEIKFRKTENLSLGARLKVTMWKGFTNQASSESPDSSPEDEEEGEDEENSEDEDSHDDGNETETPQTVTSPGLTSRFANTVWRGITNQSAESPPSPLTPMTALSSPSVSPAPSPSQLPESNSDSTLQSSPANRGSSLWGYAEKLKDSDTAATLAKVSSNWRAKALSAWSTRTSPASPSIHLDSPSSSHGSGRGGSLSSWEPREVERVRRGSLPGIDRSEAYSPPPRPAFFRPPRDSILPQPRTDNQPSPTSPELSPQSESGLFRKTKNLQASIASLTGLHAHTPSPPTAIPKTAPRPLLLGSSSVLQAPRESLVSRSAGSTPAPHPGQWADVIRSKSRMVHRDSQSSISSLSPADALGKPLLKSNGQFEWESDTTTSRIVPLNRRSISPMAPNSRLPRQRPGSASSSGTHSDRSPLSPPQNARRFEKGWGQDAPDSPATVASVPHTPITSMSQEYSAVQITTNERQRGSVVFSESNVTSLERPPHARKLVRKKTPPPQQIDDTSDSSMSQFSQTPSKSPRIRSKRHQQRPANLRIRADSQSSMEQITSSPNSLTPEWPEIHDIATTPRATTFDADAPHHSPRSPARVRKVSTGYEGRTRKVSSDGQVVRTRKVSTDGKEARRNRDSAAEEGDDEGYDDLLSAYESEESSSLH